MRSKPRRSAPPISKAVLISMIVAAVFVAHDVRGLVPENLSAALECDRASAPGRVRCVAEAVALGDDVTIAWGDVVLVEVPRFLSALRGRIGPHEAMRQEATQWQWALALVARGEGEGELRAHVRLLVCRGSVCVPRDLLAVATVVVTR